MSDRAQPAQLLWELPEGQTCRLTVRGNSMYPTLRDGQPARLRRLPPEAVRLGDVVAIADPAGEITTHRLIWRRQDGATGRLWTKGDTVAGVDPPAPPDQCLGRLEHADGRPLPRLAPLLRAWGRVLLMGGFRGRRSAPPADVS